MDRLLYFGKYLSGIEVPGPLRPEACKKYEIRRYACYGCPVGCKNTYMIPKGEYSGERAKYIFTHFKAPCFFLETAGAYSKLFEKYGFTVVLSKIENVRTKHTPEEVFNIFLSGAAAGYLNQEFYNIEIEADYLE